MRLADFIDSNADPILAEWVAFARTCDPAATMDVAALRDHARGMLTAIVADLKTTQTEAERTAKSKGNARPRSDGVDTAAEVHGADRAVNGFSIGEMVSEYRALRASVIRLWTRANGSLTGDDLADLMRFNEAIDQSLAESVSRYMQDLDQSREMFLAILGHDLRTPLGAVITSSQFMLDTGELAEPHRTLTTRVLRSARRMNTMVDDLLDFTRIRLGTGIPIVRAPADLATVAAHAVEEVAAAHPACVLTFTATGDTHGAWDAARIAQLLANLLSNAVQYGATDDPITVTAVGESAHVVLRVHNRGPTIPRSALPSLFTALKRVRAGEAVAPGSTNLGLGLYIAEQIVWSHEGTIDVRSSDADGTSVTVRLPR